MILIFKKWLKFSFKPEEFADKPDMDKKVATWCHLPFKQRSYFDGPACQDVGTDEN